MLHAISSRTCLRRKPLLSLAPNFTPIISNLPHQNRNETLDFLDDLLQHCLTIRQSKQVHAQTILVGARWSAFLAARLISAYSRFGSLGDAKRVFGSDPFEFSSNLLLWNSILRASVSHGDVEECVRLYVRMWRFGVGADAFTFPLVIRASTLIGSSKLCRIIHGHVVQSAFQFHLHSVNELLGMYGKLGRMDRAHQLFDRMVQRSYISWNTMVSGFALNYDCDGAVQMFGRMEAEGLEPNLVTWTSLLSSHARCGHHRKTLDLFDLMRSRGVGAGAEVLAVVLSVCADSDGFEKGWVIHGYVVKAGFEHFSFVQNSLICVYGKHGLLLDAKKIFLELETKSVVSWNALISSYAESGFCNEAFAVFAEMEKSDGYPLVRPNSISWSAVIEGFASKGRGNESLQLFRRMQLARIPANCVTITSVLSVCAELAALNLGQEVHGYAVRSLMDNFNLVQNGLINMYTKSGSLRDGSLIFENVANKDLVSWNSMIAGFGAHGYGELALNTFNKMIESGKKPDEVTFVAVLSACSHAGLVPEARGFFDKMISEFGIEPQLEHYACMVDLLGRAGFLQEASELVKTMPMKPNICVWGALLNSCRMHKNTLVAEKTASQIFNLNSEMTGSYMLLSNVYAASGRWEDFAKVRISAKTKGLKKIPGQSWIEVNKRFYSFSSGKAVQMGLQEVYRVLRELALQMEIEGYLLNTSFVQQDVGEEEIDIV